MEEEYRRHAQALKAANVQLKKAEVKVDKLEAENNSLWDDLQIGSRMTKLYDLMESCNLEKQAYFKGAMNGNDLKRLLTPEAIKLFTDLLRPNDTVHTDLSLCMEDDTPRVCLSLLVTGSHARADDFLRLFSLFAFLLSLFARKTALCEHLIDQFERKLEPFAILFAEMFPSLEPIPKMHGLCYHMLEQMRRLGGTGILHEGVVEATHVVDNALIRRFCCVKNLEQQLECRARAAWQHSDPSGANNIRAVDQACDARKRERRGVGSRKAHKSARII